MRFLDDARIPLDHGEAERKIRGPTLGRKNIGGSQSVRGTRVAAWMYSLLETAEQVGVNPQDDLMAVATEARRESGAVLLPADYAAEQAAKG